MFASKHCLLLSCYAILSICSLSNAVAVNTHYVISTPAPTPAKITSPALQKRADWVSVCSSGQSENCPVIGVSDVTSDGSGHYIPVCDGTSCKWLGYEEPTAVYSSGTTYDIVSTGAAAPFVVPIPMPIAGGAPPPPPPGPPPPDPPGDLPDPPEDPDPEQTTLAPEPQTTPACSNPPDATTTPVAFEDDWFTDVLSAWGHTLTYFLDYEIPLTATPTKPSSTSAAAPPPDPTCTLTSLLGWQNTDGNNYDTMTLSISIFDASFYRQSTPIWQTVWDDYNQAAATPTLSTGPGALPLYLVTVYDHDRDWVQYNYGSQAWASSDSQCKDTGWQGTLRHVVCTFSCPGVDPNSGYKSN